MVVAIGRQTRQVDDPTGGAERHCAAEGETRHAEPVGIGALDKARIGQHGVERLVDLSRPFDERLLGAGMEGSHDDEALARQIEQKVGMNQRRAAPAVAV